MTLAEITRAFNSYSRVEQLRAKERAAFDYKLALLIGNSVAAHQSNKVHMKNIYEVYPTLFDKDEIEEKMSEHEEDKFAIQFKQYAHAFNIIRKSEEANKNDK